MDIPLELQSEPFSTADVRPDVYNVEREFFGFRIYENGHGECVVGETSYELRSSGHDSKPLHTSYCSIVDVYDTYGLDIARSYIRRLELSSHEPRQILVYVIGSLALLTRRKAERLYKSVKSDLNSVTRLIPIACSAMSDELSELDKTQLRLQSPLERMEIQIPVEVLALICNSKRISKEIAAHVTHRRRFRELRPGELEFRAIAPRTQCLPEILWYIADSNKIQYLARRSYLTGDQFVMDVVDRNESLMRLGRVVVHSPRDHARLRGISESEMMKTLLRGVNLDDIGLVCAWTVQLLCELGLEMRGLSMTEAELRELFSRLVDQTGRE